ncbi:hypothetical protein E4U31_003626 [Claviceps sp. LM219 group G6]|nr:hypothetical protein E4U15_006744 [Claviceps sp. LM218 group G6]KAG6101601.1 hypothetical protein E4U31_003626 [Claviceps sp. LM219 group G6]
MSFNAHPTPNPIKLPAGWQASPGRDHEGDPKLGNREGVASVKKSTSHPKDQDNSGETVPTHHFHSL